MTDPLGPLDANGMMRNPWGTRVSEAQQEARRQRDAERIAAAVAERDRALAQAAADREREQREAGAARLADYEGQAHQRHLHGGGTEGDWPALWKELRTRYLLGQQGDRAAEDVARLRASNSMYQV